MLKIKSQIPMESFVNARHLGGYAAQSGRTRDNVLIRAGYQRQEGYERDRETLDRLGVRTIIDLRSGSERKRLPNAFEKAAGFEYLHLPVLPEDASPEALGLSVRDMGSFYIDMLETCKPSVAAVLWAVLESPGGVLFHCSAGKDRTGVIAALLLSLAGVAHETVVEEYAYTRLLLAPAMERMRASALAMGADPAVLDQVLEADPAYIEKALGHLRTVYGTAENYLLEIGFTSAETAHLEQKIVER